MSDPKFYCRAEDLAIGYGKTPLMEHIGLGVGRGASSPSSAPTVRENPPCSRRWQRSWPPRGALSCWTAKISRTAPARSAPAKWP